MSEFEGYDEYEEIEYPTEFEEGYLEFQE